MAKQAAQADTKRLTQVDFVTAGGSPWTREAGVAAKKRPASAPSQQYHRGFVVTGVPRAQAADAEYIRNGEIEAWSKMGEADRAEAIKDGRREPKPFVLDDYLRARKRTKVRAKNFGSQGAAIDAKELAIRNGWLDVRITEDKGKARGA